MMKGTHLLELDNFLYAALKEDAPYGDKTTEMVLDGSPEASAYFLAKQEMVVCGVEAALRTFELIDWKADCRVLRKDGSLVKKGTKLAIVRSGAREILLGERTALNVFQRLSGIATYTRKAMEMLKESDTKILDTRKTTPLMRRLEKYAVRTGGGTNHRMGLSDGILIKDNHIEMVGSVSEAVKRARAGGGPLWKIEVEVKNLEEFREAVKAGADVIMLDNMPDADIRKAVRMKPIGTKIEVSGGITPRRLETLARIGVDFISMGALTHSAAGADISLEIVRP